MKSVKWVVFFTLFFLGLFCYMKDRGYCNQYPLFYVPIEKEFLYQHYDDHNDYHNDRGFKARSPWGRNHNQQPARSQRLKWQDAYDMHHFNAVRTYNDAYDKIWFLPDLTWRQVSRDFWLAACAMAATKEPNAALVAALIILVSQYGLHCLDEWDYIQEKLQWSQYHFEQCAYYAGLLNQ